MAVGMSFKPSPGDRVCARHISDADWRDADLGAVDFRDCTLERVSFDNASMEGARFQNCKLADCSLSHADLIVPLDVV